MSIERLRRSDGRDRLRRPLVRERPREHEAQAHVRPPRDAEFFEASLRRARQLGQLASEVIGSNATLEEFLVEWWDTYAVTHLRPSTLATYTTLLDKWIVPYLGRKRLREITRQTIDAYAARSASTAPARRRSTARSACSRASSTARSSGGASPGTPSSASAGSPHAATERSTRARPRRSRRSARQLDPPNAALVSVLAYEGLRPGEAFALEWRDVLDDRGRATQAAPRPARALRRGGLDDEVAARPRARALQAGRARTRRALRRARAARTRTTLVFPDSEGGHLRRQNWRRRVWIPALERAGVAYFRSYDLRHTCATLLLYEGRTLNEVAEHLGHADPGFTARTYAHVMRDAATQAPRPDQRSDPQRPRDVLP